MFAQKKGEGEFELVTFASGGVIHNRSNYSLGTRIYNSHMHVLKTNINLIKKKH